MPKRKDSKRQPGTKDPMLDLAAKSLAKAEFEFHRDRSIIWIGSDGLIGRPPKSKHLVIRFWKGAHKVFRKKVESALCVDGLEWEIGPEFDLEKSGKKVDPNLVPQNLEEMLGKLQRTPHVRSCLLCKEVLEMAALGDDEYLERAVGAVFLHADKAKDPGTIPCQYPGCIHHEKVSRALALKMIELGKGDDPWKDVRGVPVSTIPLCVKEKDAPEGWDWKNQDVMQRAFQNLPQAAGDVYVRLGPKETAVHVWISLPYKSRRAELDDVATLDEMKEAHEKLAPVWSAWCRRKFDVLKELAEMDLSLDDGKETKR